MITTIENSCKKGNTETKYVYRCRILEYGTSMLNYGLLTKNIREIRRRSDWTMNISN